MERNDKKTEQIKILEHGRPGIKRCRRRLRELEIRICVLDSSIAEKRRSVLDAQKQVEQNQEQINDMSPEKNVPDLI